MVDDLPTTMPELIARVLRDKEKILELRESECKAMKLVDEMRDQIEESNELIDSWINVFDMELGDDGRWQWNQNLTQAYGTTVKVAEQRDVIVRDWNRFVPKYNAVVRQRPVGRPLAASDAQVDDVKRRRKKGHSLRAIAAATSLGLGTVRSILRPKDAVDPGLRKRELDRLRAKAYRDRKRRIDTLPAEINRVRRKGEELVKRRRAWPKSDA